MGKTKLGGRAGNWPKWLHKSESVGQTVWRPSAPTGMMRLDDDQCGFRPRDKT